MSLDCYETELLNIFFQEDIDYYAANQKLLISDYTSTIATTNKIPLITHQVYLSSLDNPQKMDAISLRKTLISLELLNNANANWKHYIWTNNPTIIPNEILAITGVEIHLISELNTSLIWDKLVDILDKANSDKSMFAKASDLIRYSALKIFGGIYRDLDYQIYKPEEFLKLMSIFKFFGGKEFDYEPTYMGSALVAAIPNHPVIDEAISLLKRNLNAVNLPLYLQYPCDKVNKQLYETGPAVITIAYLKAAKPLEDALLPANILFNWDYARNSTPDSPCYKPNPNLELNNKTIGADMFCGAWHSNKAANPRFYYLKNANNYLYIAAQDGDIEALQLNLHNGANVNYIHPDTKVTSLYIAAQNNHVEIVRLLVKAGANLDFSRSNGVTPLHIAKLNNYTEITSILLKAGASEIFNFVAPPKGINIDCYGSLNRDMFAQEGIDFDARTAEFTKDNIYKIINAEEYISSNKHPIPFISHQIYFTAKSSPKAMNSIAIDKTIKSINQLNKVKNKWKHFFWTNDETSIPDEIKRLLNVEIHLINELSDSILRTELELTLKKGESEKAALAAASDLVRYMALRKFGGIYRDIDYEIYNAIKLSTLMQAFNFLSGKEFDGEMNYIGSSLVASIANHPILNTIELLMKRNLNAKEYPNIPDYIKFPCTKYNQQMFEFGPGLLTIAFYLSANKDGNIDLFTPSHIFFNTAYIHYTTPGSICSKPNKPASFIAYINGTVIETIGADMLCGGWTPSEYYNSIYHSHNLNSYLYLAAQDGDLEAVANYLAHGANATHIYKNRATALDIAQQNGYTDIANLLKNSIKKSPEKVDSTELGCFEGDSIDIFEQEGIDYYLEDNKLIENYKNNLQNLNLNPIPLKTHQIYFSVDKKIIDNISTNKTTVTINRLNDENDTWKHNIWTNDLEAIPEQIKKLSQIKLRLISELKDTVLYKELNIILEKAKSDKSLLAQASDVARLMVLFKEGGLYRDLDNEIYKPQELRKLFQSYNFVGGKERHTEISFIGNAFLASNANHPIIKTALEEIIARNLNSDTLPEYLQYPCKHGIKIIYETGSPVISLSYYKSANQNGNIDIVAPGNVFFNMDYARYITPESRCHNPNKTAQLNNVIDEEEIQTIAGDLFCGNWQQANRLIYYPRNKDIYLYLAAQDGDLETAKTMLDNGANVNTLRVNKVPPIFIAIQNGYLEIVKLLVNKGANLDLLLNKETVEDFAKKNKHDEIYSYLINYKLFNAAFEGNLSAVIYLLNKGANIESKHVRGATAIYIAAKQGFTDIVKLLIERGANVNSSIIEGDTPLYIAASEGYTEICRLLLNAGADKEVIVNGFTPLVVAEYFGHLETTKLLLDNGAKFINDENHYALRVANFLETHPEERGNQENLESYTQIKDLLMNNYFNNIDNLIEKFYSNFTSNKTFEVVVVRYSENLSWILQEFKNERVIIYNKGADDLGEFHANCEIRKIANVGFLGGTYLYHIANYYDQLADRTLFVQGNPYDVRMFLPLVRYQSDLPSKCKNIFAQCVEITLEEESKKLSESSEEKWQLSRYYKFQPVDYDMINFAYKYIDAEMPLNESFYMTWGAEFAVDGAKIRLHPKSYYEDMLPLFNTSHPRADFFIEKLWDKVFQNKIIDKKLFNAALNGNAELVASLLDKDANIESKHISDATALYIATQRGHINVVKLLIERGANVNAAIDEGDTPLYVAASLGYVEICKLLLDAGADKDVKVNEYTPLIIAAYFEHIETVKLLLEYNANVLVDNSSMLFCLEQIKQTKTSINKEIHQLIVNHYYESLSNKSLSNIDESFEVVVARFNEDLLWLTKEFPSENIIIYNKGDNNLEEIPNNWKVINLQNIGRESHTYLYHIIKNYHQLKDRILFLQGYPFDHPALLPLVRYKQELGINCKNIIAACSPSKTLEEISTDASNQMSSRNIFAKYNLVEYTHQYINNQYNSDSAIYFVNGAQFAITKTKILNNPKAYYENLIKTLDGINPIEGYYFERLWDQIFSPNYLANLNFELFHAAFNGDEALVIESLNKGADINSIHNSNATALYAAAKKNHPNIARLLINKGADLNAPIYDGATALYTSAHNGHSEITEMLLIAGANTEIKIGNNVLLNAAIQNKRIKDVELLLKYGTVIVSDQLFTPLMAAEYQRNNSPEHLIISEMVMNHYWDWLANEKSKIVEQLDISKSFEIVVVRYKEDLVWLLKEFTNENITIYNKGPDDLDLEKLPINSKIIKIPNVGWLGGTYLYHIVTRYDSLAERTLFLQGYPYDQEILTPLIRHREDLNLNCDNLIAKCQNTTLLSESNELSALTEQNWAQSSRYSSFTQAINYNMLEFVYKFIDPYFAPEAILKMNLGAQFAIDADKIRFRSKEFYETMLPLFNQQYPRADFYLEKLWDIIFGYKVINGPFDKQLFEATKIGDSAKIIKLLDLGANINSVYISNATPIYIAVKYGHTTAVKLLISRGANVNVAIDEGDTPLSISISEGNLDICKLLLEARAETETTIRGITPLYTALYFGHIEIIKLLLDYGAKSTIDHKNYPLRTAALWQSHPKAIPDINKEQIYKQSYHLLMDNYLNRIDELMLQELNIPNDKTFEVVIVRYNEDLSWVTQEFKTEKIIIYNKGANDLDNLPINCEIRKIPNIGFLGGTYLYHIVTYYNQLADTTLFLQANPYDMRLFLPLARYKGALESECKNIVATCVETTIEENQDYLKTLDWKNSNYPNFNSSNIDMIGFTKKYIGKYPIDKKLYVNYGAQFAVDKQKILCNSIEYYQNILLVFNVRYPIEDHYLERLWDLIFNCDNTYALEKTIINNYNLILFKAALTGDIEQILASLKSGADINSKHINNATALYVATRYGYLEAVKLLIENKADVNASINEGDTPLYAAASEGYTQICKLLIDAGADKNAFTNGFSPLYIAVYFERLETVKFLLSEKASLLSSNMLIQTPIRAAAFFLGRSKISDKIYELVMKSYWESEEFLSQQALVSNTSFEVVVVRYSEDLSWIIKEFPNTKVTVYNKGIDNLSLPDNCNIIKTANVGYLGGTYLQHIANNYNNLADRVLFLQGNPFDVYVHLPLIKYKDALPFRCNNIIAICTKSTIEKENNHLNELDWKSGKYSNFILSEFDMIDFTQEYIRDYPTDAPIYFNYGAEFAVDKQKILCNPQEHYQNMLPQFNTTFPMQDHYMERLWDLLFDCDDNL